MSSLLGVSNTFVEVATSDRVVGKLGQVGSERLAERVEAELSSQHRGKKQHPVALLGEVGQSASDHVTDAFRDRACQFACGRRDALDGEQTNRLADKERVTLGLFVERRRELGRSELGGGQLDVRSYLPLA